MIGEKYLRYDLGIESRPESGTLRVFNERILALRQDLKERSDRKVFLEKYDDSRLSLRMEGKAHPTFFDIGLDHTILSMPLYPPHYPHITALKRELESWRFFYFEPRRRMREPNAAREVKHIGVMGEDLAAYLHTLRNSEQKAFVGISRTIHSIIPSVTAIDTEINPKTGEVELYVLEGDTRIPASLVSEGTLRLIGLLSIVGTKDSPSVICFEEPENGIHPRRIEMVAEYLKNAVSENTQIIATTHSPLLPDLMDDSALFVCRKIEGKTVIQSFISLPGIFRKHEIEKSINDEDVPRPSDLLLRGDLDA